MVSRPWASTAPGLPPGAVARGPGARAGPGPAVPVFAERWVAACGPEAGMRRGWWPPARARQARQRRNGGGPAGVGGVQLVNASGRPPGASVRCRVLNGIMAPMTAHSDDLHLPERTRLLHIGPQKTGTSSLQFAMRDNREALREHGVVYPGRGHRPREAVWAALSMDVPDSTRRPRWRLWKRLIREVEAAGDLRVCVSTEDFAKADADGAAKVVRDLGGGRAHVVAAARRLDKLLPSQWQQRVKMRRTSLSYEEWLEVVLSDRSMDPVWQDVWISHGIGPLVERWTEAVGSSDRFTLVVVDESDRALLARTFERMLGLPDGLLTDAQHARNPSLGIGRIELIRALNTAYEQHGWVGDERMLELRIALTNAVKAEAPWPDERRIPPMPRWAADRVAELNKERAELVRSLDVHVVGNPDHLLAPEAATSAGDADEPAMVSAELAGRALELALESTARAHEPGDAAPVASLEEVPAEELARTLARRTLRRLRRMSRGEPRG